MAGYSSKTLVEKLGIKSGFRIDVVNPPDDYYQELVPLPSPIYFSSEKKDLDFIQFFVLSQKDLKKQLPIIKNRIKQNGMIWISWPKKASKIPTDITENTIRDLALSSGLVDVKVCAINDIWSGLKLVIRVKDRK